MLSDEATDRMEPLYQDLIENMLMYIQTMYQKHEKAEQQTAKYWSVMLSLAYDILDKVLTFLCVCVPPPPEMMCLCMPFLNLKCCPVSILTSLQIFAIQKLYKTSLS